MYSASPPSRPSPAPRACARVFAEMLGPDAAGGAAAASPRPVDEHRLAGLEAVGPRAESGDGAGDLVAERERELVRQRPGAPVHQVQIGVAEAGAGDANEHLTWTRFRRRDVDSWAGRSQAVSRIAFTHRPYHMN